MFSVGQKVVCVDDKYQSCYPSLRWITKGRVYAISWTGSFENAYCVNLEGVDRSGLYYGIECPNTPFFASRFRPIVERKTDISIFTKMLNPSKTPARVE